MYHYVGNVGRGCCTTAPYKGSTIPTSNGEGGYNIGGLHHMYWYGRVILIVYVNLLLQWSWSLPPQSNTSLSSQSTGFLSCCYFCPWYNYEQLTWETHLQHLLKSHWPRYQFNYFSCCKPVWIKLPVSFSKTYSETNTSQVLHTIGSKVVVFCDNNNWVLQCISSHKTIIQQIILQWSHVQCSSGTTINQTKN